jgi:ADP-ribose pyrophosphatase
MAEQAAGQNGNDIVRVLERANVYDDNFLHVARAKVQYRHANGEMGEPVSRLAVSHGDAVGVLVYDPGTEEVVLVRQFRYPVYDNPLHKAKPDEIARRAWLLEIVAGLMEDGQTAEETARRELQEEIGYDVTGQLEHIATVYTSPGSNTEQITLFLAEVDTLAQGDDSGGGLAEEGEDTEQIKLPLQEALAMLERHEFSDAKTVLALQYLALRQATKA